MICTAEEPVPITATWRPAKSTGSSGQAAECSTWPAKRSKPANAGRFGVDSGPIVNTRNRAVHVSPSSALTQVFSKRSAAITLPFVSTCTVARWLSFAGG